MDNNQSATEILDLQSDKDFSILHKIATEGGLNDAPDTAIVVEELLVKQASLKDSDFADPVSRQFAINDPLNTHLSARYLEKCASMVSLSVLEDVLSSCELFGVRPPELPMEKIANEDDLLFFDREFDSSSSSDSEYMQKTATLRTDRLNPDFMDGITARKGFFPEEEEFLNKLASVAREHQPMHLVSVLKAFDEVKGADDPAIIERIGTPEETFLKEASEESVTVGSKTVSLDDLNDYEGTFDDYGVSIDYNADPSEIQSILDSTPKIVIKEIEKLIG